MSKLGPYFVSIATGALGWMLSIWTGPSSLPPEKSAPPVAAASQPSPAPATPPAQSGSAGQAAFQRVSDWMASRKSLWNVADVVYSELEKLSPQEVGAAALAAVAAKNSQAHFFLGYWAEVDEAAAVAWLRTLPEEARMNSFPIVDVWVKRDPEAFLGWFEKIPPEERKSSMRAFGGSAFRIASQNLPPERVLKALLACPEQPNYRNGVFTSLFSEWAQRDPARAAAEAVVITGIEDRADAVKGVAAGWKDTAAALKWLQGLPDADLSANAMKSLTTSLVQKDPKAALDIIGELPLTAANKDLMKTTIGTWSRKDPAAAAAWAAGFKEGPERMELIKEALQAVTFFKPDVAAELLSKYADQVDSFSSSSLYSSLGNRLRESKGLAAFESLANQVPEKIAGDFWDSTIPNWLAKDGPGLAEWSEGLPEGTRRTQVFEAMASAKVLRDFPGAIAWANELPNTESNRPAVVTVAKAAFYKGSGGIKIASRVLPPEKLSTTVESWLNEIVDNSPKTVRDYLAKDQVLTPESKKRITDRLQTADQQ